MFCPFFHDFRLFWNSLCCQRDHKFSGTEWHTSSRNRVVRRRMCKIGGFPLCNPFKGLLWDSSEVHSILKYTKCLMFEMWHIYTSVTVFYYSSKDSGPIDMLDKFWVYDVNVFYETVNSSQKKLNRLLRFLWHCALRTICGCRFFQIIVFFDFGNCWFEISVYFIHIFHLLPWCDVLGNSPTAGYFEAIIQLTEVRQEWCCTRQLSDELHVPCCRILHEYCFTHSVNSVWLNKSTPFLQSHLHLLIDHFPLESLPPCRLGYIIWPNKLQHL